MKIFLLIPLFCFAISASGQYSEITPIGAGMGHATVGLQSPIALFSNQAGLVGMKKWAVVAAAEQRFLLSELQTVAVGFAMPTRSGTFGLTAQSFGFEAFKQQKIGLSYARKLWSTLAVGAQFDYFHTRIPEYGSRGVLTFEVGLQANISKSLVVGAHVFSPAQVELAGGENLPSIFSFGITWQAAERLVVCTELEKTLEFSPNWKTGLSYQPVESISLRAGFNTEPSMLFFGVGFAFGNGLQADMAGSFHQTLGFSPTAGVIWN
ncbi:MAG: hypothetical protein K9J37_08325 [Saprospiraceae bacterium]|nr:hypothetical protein [Saprospiraceae bacterium]MCF8249906.1 hypothetical protein [Saprospiraceae bacterium]MCF8279319.1 hypothetical protein [Bacteroidales bacterium]MCF8310010.1 hypothetical protein [Saprospiraceae bacterium]MCF8438910.1 hypothetical protein [Saprospiraceae bacterium]